MVQGASAWVWVATCIYCCWWSHPQLFAHRDGDQPPWRDLVGDCLTLTLPIQALMTLTPSIPLPMCLIPKPPDSSWYMGETGDTQATFLLARPLIYYHCCSAFGSHFFW